MHVVKRTKVHCQRKPVKQAEETKKNLMSTMDPTSSTPSQQEQQHQQEQQDWVLVHAGNGGSYWYNTMTGESRQSTDVAISHVVAQSTALAATATPYVYNKNKNNNNNKDNNNNNNNNNNKNDNNNSNTGEVINIETIESSIHAAVTEQPQKHYDYTPESPSGQRRVSVSVPASPRHTVEDQTRSYPENNTTGLKRTQSTRSVLVRQRRLGHAVRGGRGGRARKGSCSTRSVRSSSVHTTISTISVDTAAVAECNLLDSMNTTDKPQLQPVNQAPDHESKLAETLEILADTDKSSEHNAIVESEDLVTNTPSVSTTTNEYCENGHELNGVDDDDDHVEEKEVVTIGDSYNTTDKDCADTSFKNEETSGAEATLTAADSTPAITATTTACTQLESQLTHRHKTSHPDNNNNNNNNNNNKNNKNSSTRTNFIQSKLVVIKQESVPERTQHIFTQAVQHVSTGASKFVSILRATLPKEGSIVRMLVELIFVILFVSLLTPKHVSPSLLGDPFFQTAVAGERIVIAVSIEGVPAPQLQWRLNGVDIPGASKPVLLIEHAGKADSGTYTCVAENPAGRVVWEEGFLNVVDDLQTHATAAAAADRSRSKHEGTPSGVPGTKFLDTGDATYWRELLASPHADNLSGDDMATLRARRCLMDRAPQPVRSSAIADGGASVVAAGEHAGYLSCFRSVAHALAAPNTRDTMVKVLERLRSLHGLSHHPYRLVNVMAKLDQLAQDLESGASDAGLTLRLVAAVAYEGGLYSSGQPESVSRARLIPEAILGLVTSGGGARGVQTGGNTTPPTTKRSGGQRRYGGGL